MAMRAPDSLQQRVFERLRQARLRPTSARVCVLQILLALPEYRLGAESIFQQLLSAGVSISLGTIYRVLKELAQHGLLVREWQTRASGNKSLYLIRPEAVAVPLCHLACDTCQHRVAIQDAELNQQLARVAHLYGWIAHDSTVMLRCAACAGTPETAASAHPL